MKQTINSYQFHDAFKRMDRADAFTYEGLEVLFKGLEEYEEDTNEEIELDVIALCCDYCEMSLSEMIDAYKHMIDEEILNDEDTNEDIELDVIALCCDYCEMSLSEMIDAYKHMIDEEILNDEDTNAVTDWFYNQTWVLGQTDIDTYVFKQF
jgi:hypothetical protein